MLLIQRMIYGMLLDLAVDTVVDKFSRCFRMDMVGVVRNNCQYESGLKT
jgi:hypothetical protein